MLGREGLVTVGTVGRRQPPGRGTIAGEAAGVGDAVGAVDAHLRAVLREIVDAALFQPARVEPHEGIMREEQRAAHRRAQRQANVVVGMAIVKGRTVLPALAVGPHVDGVGRRSCSQHEGDQRLVPAAQLQRHGEILLRAPVPHHGVRRRAEAPPVHATPQVIDLLRQLRCALPHVFTRGEQAHHQEGRFHDVAAVVTRRKGDSCTGVAVGPVCEGAAIARQHFEKPADPRDALHRLVQRDEAALGPGDHRHDAEARSARRHGVHHVRCARTFPRHAARRVREVGEIAQRLALHLVEQAACRHLSHVTVSDCTSRALGPTMRMKSPGSQPRVMLSSAGPRS